jgi:hypothetical protein
LLSHIFDQVHWNPQGNQLRLSKYFQESSAMMSELHRQYSLR